LVLSVVGAYILSTFLISLMSFSLRTHGPMGTVRYQEMLSSFPFWAVGLAIAGLFLGVVVLKKFEFSYKKNFLFIVLTFVIAVLISGWLVDYLGLDRAWSKQGQMRKLYQRYDGGSKVLPWRDDGFSVRYKNGQSVKNGYTGH